jgi:hypothetical protein
MQRTYLLLGDRSKLKVQYITEAISMILRTQHTREGVFIYIHIQRDRVREGEGSEMLHYHICSHYFNSDIPLQKIKSLKPTVPEEGRANEFSFHNTELQMNIGKCTFLK